MFSMLYCSVNNGNLNEKGSLFDKCFYLNQNWIIVTIKSVYNVSLQCSLEKRFENNHYF